MIFLEHIQVIHHGAIDGVTGSCHELKIGNKNGILVDCGSFQGEEASARGAGANRMEIEFPIDHIQALLVTHCHIDHVGRIPYLLLAGFRGPIYCSKPTAKLIPMVLEDALQIGGTNDKRLLKRFSKMLKEQIREVAYHEWTAIELDKSESTLEVRYAPAGHVLGSAYIECRLKRGKEKYQVLFSGDLGAKHSPLLPSPQPPYGTDLLILESTYGDKNHTGRKLRRAVLKKMVERCFADRGVIIIPAFSIGRTQELLYELEQIIYQHGKTSAHDKGNWEDVEIVVDSPLASRFTEIYKELRGYWDSEAKQKISQGRHPLSFEQLTTIGSHKEHLATIKYLEKTARPTIVIAASGMCAGGRVVNYLKALLDDKRTDVLFVGYQAYGTHGQKIQRYGPRGGYVEIDEKRYDIEAQIRTIGGYSAHADQKNLLDFVRKMKKRPKEIRLVHGDNETKEIFQKVLEKTFPEIEVKIPRS